MRKAALHNLGCKVNAYETEAMEQLLEAAGYEIVSFEEKADVYVINTCSVTNVADKKSRQMLHRAKAKNPDAVVVAAGCYVQAAADKLREDAAVDLIIGNNRKADLVPLLEAWFAGKEIRESITDLAGSNEYEKLHINKQAEHTRAFIKVQDGCNQFCSYCIIPFVRGRVRSRKQEDVLAEVRGLAEKGFQEVVITGIHLSSYGMDFIGETDGDYLKNGKDLRGTAFERAYLVSLLEEIAKVDGIRRIRLGSLEPRIITEEFAGRLSAIPQLCPHFHLSLQSGCNETLKRMNRHYTAEEYYEKVQILRKYFEHPAITTDVIVGFPGETAEEFAVTKTFLEKVHFFEMHIFKYSRRKGTVADKLPGQLTDAQKTERSGQLLALEKEQSREFRAHYLGQEVEVLIEEQKEIGGKVYWLGHTDTYVKAAFAADSAECMDYSNRLVHGRAVSFLSDEVLEIALNF